MQCLLEDTLTLRVGRNTSSRSSVHAQRPNLLAETRSQKYESVLNPNLVKLAGEMSQGIINPIQGTHLDRPLSQPISFRPTQNTTDTHNA